MTPAKDWSGDEVCLRMNRGLGWHSQAEIENNWLSDKGRKHLLAAARHAAPSVVQVRTTRRILGPFRNNSARVTHETTRLLGGTGVIIDGQGVILTNEHVIRNADSIEVVLSDGSLLAVETVIIAPHRDLAVLRVRGAGRLTPLGLEMAPCECGAGVVAVGNLGDDQGDAVLLGVVTRPMVSLQDQLDPAHRRSYEKLVESTAQLEPGFSGGPLLDIAGNLVGINVAASGPDELGDVWGYSVQFDQQTQAMVLDLVQQILASSRPVSR